MQLSVGEIEKDACPECYGTGYAMSETADEDGPGISMHTIEKCDACKGTGRKA